MKFFLVQVLNHFLVRRGQDGKMAGEKTIKVLCVSTALWRRREKRDVGWENDGTA